MRALIPILVQPRLYSMKNRILGRSVTAKKVGRDSVVAVFALLTMFGIYYGARWMLERINEDPNLIFLPPAYPLALVLMLLTGMLFISSLATALGTLFLSEDLDLILGSPISPWSFYSGKVMYVMLNTCWMPLLFLLPLFFAFGQAYHAPFIFYVASVLLMIPYFLIPVSLAVALAVILTLVIPPNRTREVLFLTLGLVLAGFYFLVDLLGDVVGHNADSSQIFRAVAFLSSANTPWMPATWIAVILEGLMQSSERDVRPYYELLFSTAATAASIGYILVTTFHFSSYSKARTILRMMSRGTFSGGWSRGILLGRFGKRTAAMILKELKIVTRDISLTVQLFLLTGLCVIYVVNLKLFVSIENFPESARVWWQNFFFMCNCCMGAFVITSICSRFVFPSLSLEGRAFWILHSSPMELAEVMRAKFWCWYFPIAAVSSVVLSAGAFAIGGGPVLLLVNGVVGWVLSFGIVGLGIGLGARFAFFGWEHSTQLAASFGSFVFMLMSCMLIFASMLPTYFLIRVQLPDLMEEPGRFALRLGILGFLTACIFVLNYLVARISMRLGRDALEREND